MKILGCGSYQPEKIVTNNDLETNLETSNEWIVSRTGIEKRHIARPDEFTSHLAYKASIRAIKNAGIDKSEIDMVIVATTTADNIFPSTATKLQALLELGNTPSFDVQAVCSGFVYGLDLADSYLKAGKAKTILLVGAEKMSNIVDWSDRSTCILFGDGAGAMVLQQATDSQLVASKLFSDGHYMDILYADGGAGSNQEMGKLRMLGREVYRHAVDKMGSALQQVLDESGVSKDEISLFVPHQANIRIINSLARKLDMPIEKVAVTIDKHANCSAASIPMAFEQAVSEKNIKRGDYILLSAFGGGLTWGAALLKY